VTVRGQKLQLRPDLDDFGYAVHPLPLGDAIVRIRHKAPGPVVVTVRAQ
jgi:hypothetical protein